MKKILSDKSRTRNGRFDNQDDSVKSWPSGGRWDNQDDFVNAQRGLMGRLDPLRVPLGYHTGQIEEDDTHPIVWDLTLYSQQMIQYPDIRPGGIYPMISFPPPDSSLVNPSLWRNAVLNSIHGVFEVLEKKIFQVRAYDLSNISMVRAGEITDGVATWVVIDPLISAEVAYASWENFVREYDAKYGPGSDAEVKTHQIGAVIFTHSHVDHYGGIDGLERFFIDRVTRAGSVEIWAPEGFEEHAISENVIVGNAMSRRACYMYGAVLTSKDMDGGQVDGGLGKTSSTGSVGIRMSTDTIKRTWVPGREGKKVAQDRLEVRFQNVPGTEAPAEMMFYFPEYKALCGAEDLSHTFHNVLTLRGAQVRDPLAWSKYLEETIELFIDSGNPDEDAQILFNTHHWPTWNEDLDPSQHPGITMTESENRIKDFAENQRDLYKYIHDQTIRLTNHGYTIQEVGEMIELPATLDNQWYNHGYYGSVNHNAKAVYQRYIGWFDGNPASLHQLPPAKAGAKYREYLELADWNHVYNKAYRDFSEGQYRWVAMLMNHYVYGGDPDASYYEAAKNLLIECYRKMAVQAESGPWRDFYLVGAMELENGVNPDLPAPKTLTPAVIEVMPLDMVFDYLSIRFNGPKATGWDYTIYVEFTDVETDDELNQDSVLYIKNSVLRYKVGVEVPPVGSYTDGMAVIKLSREDLNKFLSGEVISSDIDIEGDETAAGNFFGAIDEFNYWFNIVTANPTRELR